MAWPTCRSGDPVQPMTEATRPPRPAINVLPAGLQAAITAADRGHEVFLFEKSGSLGGGIQFAEHVPFKADLKKFMDVLIRRVERRAITVHLNTPLTPERARGLRADVIIAAVGADPIVPSLPGYGFSGKPRETGWNIRRISKAWNVLMQPWRS